MKARLALALLLATATPLAGAHGEGGPPALPGGPLGGAGQADYRFTLTCGEPPGAENDAQQLLCPLAVFDEEDIMGSPRLVHHPKSPDVVAFNALHGGPGLEAVFGEPPEAYARNNAVHQPHTTFRTVSPWGVLDGGQLDWKDQPYYSHYAQQNTTQGGLACPPLCPSEILHTNRVYGIDNALAVDATGRLFEASLYAMRDDEAQPFDYGLTLWKQRGVEYDRNQDANYVNLRAESPGNRMERVDLATVQGYVVAAWRESTETSTLPEPSGRDLSSWIGVAHSAVTTDAGWLVMPKSDVVGPCAGTTNLATWDNATFIGCRVAPGYAMREGAREGELDVWRIRVPEGAMEYVSTAHIAGEEPALAIRSDGRFVLASTQVDGPHDVHLEVSFADHGRGWSTPRDLGDAFADDGREIERARVNALAFHRPTGNLFVVYWEQYRVDTSSPGAATVTMFNKRLGSIADGADQVRALLDLELGDPANRKLFPPSVEGLDNEAVYEDLHDDLEVWHDKKTGDERLFVAYGDYGLVRYAEIEQENAVPIPGLAPEPPVAANPLADPQTTQQSAQVVAGVFAGALSLAMALRLLLARNKQKLEAPSLGGK